MKFFLHSVHARGGVTNQAILVARGLQELGHEVRRVSGARNTKPSADADYAVYFNATAAPRDASCPRICVMHHMTVGYEAMYVNFLRVYAPDAVACLDDFTARDLGRRGLCDTNATRIGLVRQAVDVEAFSHLPYPKDFTIGCIGGDSNIKRFSLVEQVAAETGIPAVVHRDSDGWIRDIRDFYAKISCYVVASFDDGGPMPAQEARLCGRPVVTTRVGQMPRVIEHGVDGLHYDGTLDGCIAAVEEVKQDFHKFKHPQFIPIASPRQAAESYLDLCTALT